MSQGLVDETLRLRPLERRRAIEEVGGVRQHRHQMEESRRRRERAQEHLARARLLRDELSPRLKDLKRAARRTQQADKVRSQLDAAVRDYFFAAAAELTREMQARHERERRLPKCPERRSSSAAPTRPMRSPTPSALPARQTVESAVERIRAARAELTLEHQQQLEQQQRSWLSREAFSLSARLDAHHAEGPIVDVAAAGRALADADATLSAARAQRDERERVRAEASNRYRRAVAEIDEMAAQAARLVRRWRANAVQRLQAAEDGASVGGCRGAGTPPRHPKSPSRLWRQSGSRPETLRVEREQRARLAHRIEEADARLSALAQRAADAIFGELMDATLHDSFEDAMNAVRQGVHADAGRVMALPGEAADRLIRSLLDSVDSVDDEAAAVESASRGRTEATPDEIMVRSDEIAQGGGRYRVPLG